MATMLTGNALITGAGSGIGQALALAYAQAGCRAVALADVNAAGIKDTALLIQKHCPDAKVLEFVVDVADQGGVDAMVSEIVEAWGELHFAANVAGITCQARTKTAEYPIDEFDKVHSINTRGLLLCVQAELKAMREQGLFVTSESTSARRAQRGSIVNIASVCGLSALRRIMPYITSKHAVLGITRTAALDHARDGIRVNAVCPGFVETPMLSQRIEMAKEASIKSFAGQEGLPAGRMAMVEEIADVCVFLSSSMSSYINGASIVVDGGKMASFQYSEEFDS